MRSATPATRSLDVCRGRRRAVAARHEQRQHVVVHECRHLGPGPRLRLLVERLEERPETVVVEHVPVAGGRSVEGDAATAGLPLLVGGGDEDRRGDLQVAATAPGALEAALQRRQGDLPQDLRGAERVSQKAVGDLARHLGHPLAHPREQHGRTPQPRWRRAEVRRHESVRVELAPEVELPARLPGVPDRPEGEDVLPHPRRRTRPHRAVAALDVPSDLRAEPQRKAPIRQRLEVPRRVGDVHRRAREGEGDRRRHADAGRRLSGLCRREERIPVGLGHADSVEAERFQSRGALRHFADARAPHDDVRGDRQPHAPMITCCARRVRPAAVCAAAPCRRA